MHATLCGGRSTAPAGLRKQARPLIELPCNACVPHPMWGLRVASWPTRRCRAHLQRV